MPAQEEHSNGSLVQDVEGVSIRDSERKDNIDFVNNFEEKIKMDAKANHFSFKFKKVKTTI